MRVTRYVLAGVVGGALLALPVWGAETFSAPADGKFGVKGEVAITRPELQALQGVKGWRVNGEEIPMSAVQEMALLYNGPYLLQDLVMRKLLEQAAKRDGLTVTDAEVEAQAKSLREELGLADQHTFERFLRQQRLTEYGYRDMARTYAYMQKVIGKQVFVSEEEIALLYDKGKDTAYRRPETVTFRMGGTLDQKAAQAAVAAIKQGKSFAEEAKKLATSDQERALAGEVQVYGRGLKEYQLPQELETRLFNAPLNQVVGPFQLTQPVSNVPLPNYWLFVRVEKKTDEYKYALTEVRDAIREQIRRAKIMDAWPKWLEAQMSGAEITPLKAE